MAKFDIRAVTNDAELRATWPVARQLRPHLDEDGFVAQCLRQFEGGYLATALYDEGIPRAFAGWRALDMLATGKQVYVDDLVTDETVRSRGYGKAMLDWLKAEAKRLGCARLQLDSGTFRKDAHAFYLREGLRIEAFHLGITL
ncbi:MAG: GNAT family N-acetyltransferase [Pseudomonadota bacterium]|nr:GNAT family N-acetyltransferase [Pseudomonadota bacterium]MDQ3230026.1 GNAT family N-acetyltransferase [Pseudomonadota bacterium]